MTHDSLSPLDELLAQFDSRVKRLSDVEKEQLKAVLADHQPRPLEQQLRELQPPASLSDALRDLPYRPSDRLTALVALLDEWFSQPKFDSLIEALIDHICGK